MAIVVESSNKNEMPSGMSMSTDATVEAMILTFLITIVIGAYLSLLCAKLYLPFLILRRWWRSKPKPHAGILRMSRLPEDLQIALLDVGLETTLESANREES